MALVLIDRAQETATANTTVSFTLSGANTGYQTLAGVGDTNTTYYGATDGTNWEVGIGTYSTTGPTLTRTTILSSSNSNTAVSTFTSPLSVWVDYPAGKSVYEDANGVITGYPISGGTIDNTVIGGTTPAAGTFTTITGQTGRLNGTGQNLFTQSQLFSTWNVASLGLVSGGSTDPLGTSTASTIIADGTTAAHALQLNINQSNIPITTSVYAKAGTNNFLQIRLGSDGVPYANFNLSTGALGTVAGGTATITASTNGFYRCTFTVTSATGTAIAFNIVTSGTATRNESNSLATSVIIWGAQYELGTTANTYIPTTTTAVYGTPTLSFSGVSTLGLESNGSLFLQPAGTGALQAQATTSSAVGGNARGANAVDWQTSRSAASQVASGTASVIGGGQGNTASSLYASLVGGLNNTSSNIGTFVGGGQGVTATRDYAVATGGISNASTGYFNFIGGGASNSGTANAAVTTNTTTIALTAQTTVYLSSANANIRVGALVTGTGVSNYTYATSTVTTGTPAVMNTSTISGTTLTVGSLASGTIIAGQRLTGTGVSAGTYIVSGAGSTWTVTPSQTVASTTITGTAYTFTISQNATTAAGVTLSFYTPHGVVVGGGNNQATGSYSFIGGGGNAGVSSERNVASGDWGFVGGGRSNTASGIGAVITGGGIGANGVSFPNFSSGASSFIGGGANNNTSNNYGGILAGFGNICSGVSATNIGGRQTTDRGINGITVINGGANPLGANGNDQACILTLARQTTDATATALTSDTGAAGSTNQVILPNNSAYYFKGSVIANVTGAANGASWSFEGAIMRGANAASTVFIGTPQLNRVATTTGASTWVIALTTDTTNGGLRITVTGVAATTIRWVAKVETTEVTY